MENKSQMVVAEKFQLTEPLSINGGTWRKDGRKQLVHRKVVSRQFVEDRNSHDNNELYVIDEEASLELEAQRTLNIKEKEENAKREKLTTADLIDAMVNKTSKKVEEPREIDLLRAECDELNIEYSPRAGVKKLKELLNK